LNNKINKKNYFLQKKDFLNYKILDKTQKNVFINKILKIDNRRFVMKIKNYFLLFQKIINLNFHKKNQKQKVPLK
jgi:hypothetical protein